MTGHSNRASSNTTKYMMGSSPFRWSTLASCGGMRDSATKSSATHGYFPALPPSLPDPTEEQWHRQVLHLPTGGHRVDRGGCLQLPDQTFRGHTSPRQRLHLEGSLQRDGPGHHEHFPLHGGQCLTFFACMSVRLSPSLSVSSSSVCIS
jgi:hypothetical protein